MSYQQTFTCDVCGAVRGPSNHWWMAIPVVSIAPTASHSEYRFMPWCDAVSTDKATTHLCGESCAATQLTRYLAIQKEQTQ